MDVLLRNYIRHPIASKAWMVRGGYVMRRWCAEKGLDRPAPDLDFALTTNKFNAEETRLLFYEIVAPLEGPTTLRVGAPLEGPTTLRVGAPLEGPTTLRDGADTSLTIIFETATWTETAFPGTKVRLRGPEIDGTSSEEFDVDLGPYDPTVDMLDVMTIDGIGDIHVPSKETACAWKIHALFERGSYWLPKHMGDAYVLMTQWDLNDDLLRAALKLAFESRDTNVAIMERLFIGNMGTSSSSRRRWEKYHAQQPATFAKAIPKNVHDAVLLVGQTAQRLIMPTIGATIGPVSHMDDPGRETHSVTLVSFGHSHGKPSFVSPSTCVGKNLPANATIWINVRHWPPPPKTVRDACDGRTTRLATEFFKQSGCEDMYVGVLERVVHAASHGSPGATLTVAIGCEDGRHRSVAIVERLARDLKTHGLESIIEHRDVDKKHLKQSKQSKQSKHS